MSLHPVWGHDEVRRSLARARLRDTLPSAMLVHGAPGVGKQRLALWISRLVLCEDVDDEGPCGSCKPCRLALSLEHPDVHWYFPLPRPSRASTPEKLAGALEDARNAELAELREDPLRPSHSEEARAIYLAAAKTLRKKAHTRPSMSEAQIFIIADAETLVPQESSPEAANALLKLLEEPPASSRFILTSSEPGRLLSTIRSRTLPLHLATLEQVMVESFLREVAGASDEDAARAARLAHGSIGRALGFLPDGEEPGPLERLRQDSFHLLRAGVEPGPGRGYQSALSFKVAGARGLLHLFAFVEEWIRDLAAAAADAPEKIVNLDARDYLERIVRERDIRPEDAARAMEVVEEAREQARGNVNPQLIVTGLSAGLRARLLGTGEVAS